MSGERWIEVGGIEDIPREGVRRVKRSGKPHPVAVFRTADDGIFALINHCPHRGAPLSEGFIHGCVVTCPLHGWTIDLESGKAQAPDEGAAGRIAVELRDGRIFLAAWAVGAPAEWEE
ncbi:MAG: nitrite reductase (NAD(P)H) small subunit [Stellaceae bacterium]